MLYLEIVEIRLKSIGPRGQPGYIEIAVRFLRLQVEPLLKGRPFVRVGCFHIRTPLPEGCAGKESTPGISVLEALVL